MDWRDTEQQAAFREEVRAFIRERFPDDYRPEPRREQSIEPEDVYGYEWAEDRRSADPVRRRAAIAWAEALAERGWIAPHWPREFGGADLGVMENFILQEEMMRAGVPTVNGIGAFLVGPTLLAHGTEEQRRRHLPGISAGKVTWAQGFSEPNAGSDLAGLRTRAVRDGDHYIVNGQKVWTSQGQYADWLFILARTDPEADPRHRGISFFLLPADAPGVTIRPIEDLRGGEPFCEVFFDDVKIPAADRVGEENRGWYVAMSTLDFERSGIGSTIRYRRSLQRLLDAMRGGEGGEYLRPDWRTAVRHDAVRRYIEVRQLHNLALHTASKQAAGEPLNYEPSVNQLFSAELHQRLARTGAKAFGQYGTLWQFDHAPLDAAFCHDQQDAIAHTFLAGSSEVQRNVIATRGLGLPRK